MLSSVAAFLTFAGAARASGWSVQFPPNVSGAIGNDLTGVSCATVDSCTAVGVYVLEVPPNNQFLPLAEHWDGTSWQIQSTPTPAGSTQAQFNGVSCAAQDACTAVGSYRTSAGVFLALVEHWDGIRWRIQRTPELSGRTATVLNGVSCTSSRSCTAVGDQTSGGATFFTLAENSDGASWQIQSAPNVPGQSANVLSAVSCTARPAGCTAVGYHQPGNGDSFNLAERWSTGKWRIQATPDPAGAADDQLNGVACASALACTAVGSAFIPSTGGFTLAERWDGATWQIQPTPSPPAPGFGVLNAVACPAASACEAVGRDFAPPSQFTLAEGWDGSTWQMQPTPILGETSTLNGVACPTSSVCMAVGEYSTGGLGGLQTATLAEPYTG